MELVVREAYLRWLTSWRDKDVIKVVTGVRRCGKSTLLRQFQDALRASGVDSQHIITVDLENVEHHPLAANYMALHAHVMANAPLSGTTYVFIDEVQMVPEFEKAVASLRAQPHLDVYITGSNASLLASDLATRLTGRYVELSILPLSFHEWMSVQNELASMDAYRQFAQYGSFPFIMQLANQPTAITQYLGGVLDTIISRDVAVRRRVANLPVLLDLVSFMADNIGNLTSPRRIADKLTSSGRKVSAPTIESYLDGLVEAYLLYPVNRYNIRSKRRLERIQKYYLVDPGLRTALLGRSAPDRGRVLENVIYLELLR
ncbi:MAG: ATP-binding protein, partial [Micrococcales bacterium]|nr:ATP-binding protein [Micrococcales bacterium]